MGNVLIEWNPEHLYRRLIPNEQERSGFLTTVCTPDWNLQQDLGRTWAEAISELTAMHPDKADLIKAYSDSWHEMVPGEISGSVEILEDLISANVPLYAITNFSSEKFAEAQDRFPFLKTSFRDVVVSADERLVKPDPRIYQVLLDRNGLDPSACIFIDDSEANVEAARQVGMTAHHFTNADTLRCDLARLGIISV